jgi:hypothetical protein
MPRTRSPGKNIQRMHRASACRRDTLVSPKNSHGSLSLIDPSMRVAKRNKPPALHTGHSGVTNVIANCALKTYLNSFPCLSEDGERPSTECTKTEVPRPISLPASAIAALEKHRKRQDEFRRQFGPEYRTDLIFANPDGSPFKPDSISAAVSPLFRRLKLPKGASLHSLRHSHCSHLSASGVPLPSVSARLEHGSIRMT